jgi:hypothetical protein
MKKMSILAALTVSLFGFVGSIHADEASAAPSCSASAAEQSFMDNLSEQNKKAFCAMTEDQRSACMEMAGTADNYGNQMTPDQAVESMGADASGSCSSK